MVGKVSVTEKYLKNTDFDKEWEDSQSVGLRTNSKMWEAIFRGWRYRGKVEELMPFLRNAESELAAHYVMSYLFKEPTPFLLNATHSYINELKDNEGNEKGIDKDKSEENEIENDKDTDNHIDNESDNHQENDNYIIGVQFRSGDLIYGKQNTERQHLSQIECFISQSTTTCLNQAKSHCIYFITSDSPNAIMLLEEGITAVHDRVNQKTFQIKYIQGSAPHIDYAPKMKNQDRNLYLKLFTDWWILCRADALVISRSGFSESAVWTVPKKAWQIIGNTCNFEEYKIK